MFVHQQPKNHNSSSRRRRRITQTTLMRKYVSFPEFRFEIFRKATNESMSVCTTTFMRRSSPLCVSWCVRFLSSLLLRYLVRVAFLGVAFLSTRACDGRRRPLTLHWHLIFNSLTSLTCSTRSSVLLLLLLSVIDFRGLSVSRSAALSQSLYDYDTHVCMLKTK